MMLRRDQGLSAARAAGTLFLACTALLAAGCATMPGWISSSGASREQVRERHDTGRIEGIALVDVSDSLARRLAAEKALARFSDIYGEALGLEAYRIGPGDVIEVSIWEAPPAMLFGSLVLEAGGAPAPTSVVTLPEQMVSIDGTITVPFAGRVAVKGRTTQEIEEDITRRLHGKANQAQVLVRVIQNNTSYVTVVGEVNQSLRMALTPTGERLLDALAAGGGVQHPVSRMSIQLSREDVTATMPLDAIIRDPRQNILLQPSDVVTALFQPRSFSVLGAAGRNEEIPLEAQGISLAQALGRAGGLVDNRADARGVFVFRFEDRDLVPAEAAGRTEPAADGTVPVIYQVDLRDPASFFITQNFPVQDRDVIYVANSPAAEFDKFLRLVVSVAVPSVSINRALMD